MIVFTHTTTPSDSFRKEPDWLTADVDDFGHELYRFDDRGNIIVKELTDFHRTEPGWIEDETQEFYCLDRCGNILVEPKEIVGGICNQCLGDYQNPEGEK